MDQELLELIQTYFKGVGNITKQGENYINYRVQNLEGLKVIIDHFDSYPLKTQNKVIWNFSNEYFILCLIKNI